MLEEDESVKSNEWSVSEEADQCSLMHVLNPRLIPCLPPKLGEEKPQMLIKFTSNLWSTVCQSLEIWLQVWKFPYVTSFSLNMSEWEERGSSKMCNEETSRRCFLFWFWDFMFLFITIICFFILIPLRLLMLPDSPNMGETAAPVSMFEWYLLHTSPHPVAVCIRIPMHAIPDCLLPGNQWWAWMGENDRLSSFFSEKTCVLYFYIWLLLVLFPHRVSIFFLTPVVWLAFTD